MSINVTNENAKDCLVNGRWMIEGKMKPELDSDEQKSFTLMFTFKDVSVRQIIQDALSQKKINWVNNNRKKFDAVEDQKVYELNYSGGNAQLTDEQVENSMAAKLAAMTPEEQEKYIREKLLKK